MLLDMLETRAMRAGTAHHAVLEAETAPEQVVVVKAESAEDWQALRLLTTAVGLRLLEQQGIAREVPLFGKLHVRTHP